MSGNASISQYVTPAPVPSIGPPPRVPGQPHEMPYTGFPTVLVAVIGFVVLTTGLIGRLRARSR